MIYLGCDTEKYTKDNGEEFCGIILKTIKLNREEAENTCRKYGGQLPYITSKKENDDIYNLSQVMLH